MTPHYDQILAVDWSGNAKRKQAAEAIWLAQVTDGSLTRLTNGLGRDQVVEEIVSMSDDVPTVVGLDFCFGLPEWYARSRGWRSAPDVWRAISREGPDLLAKCDPPFWGPKGRKRPTEHPYLRVTDRENGGKSAFQIGGGGAVGTASLRGMPNLVTLRGAGFSIWPFDRPGDKLVVEIYPKLFTGDLVKTRWTCRHEFAQRSLASQDEAMRERAAGSEDALDAAVSALALDKAREQLRKLEPAREGTPYFIEGKIWTNT